MIDFNDGFSDDCGRWRAEAMRKRRMLRKHNAKHPHAPLCAG